MLECQGSVLTNKYAEGYPGRRYYGGCEWVDVSEQLAIDRAKALFGAEHANVQPHSGAQANAAVYHALLEPGDTIMGLSLAHGGHLTHGMKINVSGRLYDIAAYEVDRESSLIDMDEVARIARERRPKLLLAGWSAYPRQLDFARFREIADEVGALLMVDMAHFAGLVAAGLHPNPIEHGADVVTTTTHKTLGGPRAGMILCKQEHAKKIDSAVFPGQQGGPLEHVIAAKAVALRIAASELFAERQRRTIDGAQALARELLGRRATACDVLTGGTDVHLVLVDLRDSEPALSGQRGRGPPARDRHHGQPQRGAVRPAPADGGLGPAHRHAGAGHARPAARGLRRGRADPRGRADAEYEPASRRAGRARAARSSSATRCTRVLGGAPVRVPEGAARVAPHRPPAPAMLCASRWRTRTELDALYAFLVAAAVTALLTPLTMRLARRRGRDRRAARARPVRPPHAAARRPCDLRRRAGRGALIFLPRGYADEHQPVARRAARRRADHARRRARRPLRPAPRC